MNIMLTPELIIKKDTMQTKMVALKMNALLKNNQQFIAQTYNK